MGPSGKTRTRNRMARKYSTRRKSELKRSSTKTTSTSTPTLKIDKNQESREEVVINSPSRSSSNDEDFPKTEGIEFEAVDDVSTSTSTGCSTPKGQRFRIPEIRTCPPAPKKQRVISNCSLQRTPIAFFAPPDLELFFYFALRGISV